MYNNWDIELFDFFQDELQKYQNDVDNLNKSISILNEANYNLQNENNLLLTENKLLKKNDINTCCICLDNNINIIIRPCNHACICNQCSLNDNLCPICREPIQEKLKFFL